MGLFRRSKAPLDRRSALSGRPCQATLVSRKDRPDGGAVLTVMLQSARWQRWLGGGRTRERSFGLDAYGLEVFEACDGKRSVSAIIRRFGKVHHLSRPEAETAVTTFIKTLLGKGLITMELDRPDRRGGT